MGDNLQSALQKARANPESRKARILAAARRVFGEFGFHGATTRLIAQEAGIDISTLHYHWGDKSALYQAVIFDLTEDLKEQLRTVEKVIRGKPLAQRMDIAIAMMVDYLFEHPEISNLNLLRCFAKTRAETTWDVAVPEFAADIARSMDLQDGEGRVTTADHMKIIAMMMSIHNFISGEEFFRSMLELDRDEYRAHAKETLKFMLIPAFLQESGER